MLIVHRQAPSSMTKPGARTQVKEHVRDGAPQVHDVGLELGFAFVRPSRKISYISSSLALVCWKT